LNKRQKGGRAERQKGRRAERQKGRKAEGQKGLKELNDCNCVFASLREIYFIKGLRS